MLLINSIITAKTKDRNIKKERYSYDKKVEDKIEELSRKTLIDYYTNGGM